MTILITNDDGIYAKGIATLARVAVEAGHDVLVVAPLYQHSATSHKMTLTSSLMVKSMDWPGMKAYALDGSPVDCVRVAKYLVDKPIDFCLSGINDGENTGCAVIYSGTAAAAREASMNYIPSVAVSVGFGADESMRENVAREAIKLMEVLKDKPMPRLCFANLNAPAIAVETLKPLVLAPLSDAYFLDGYEERKNPHGKRYFWLEAGLEMEPHPEGSDIDMFFKGHMTLTFVGGFKDHNDAFSTLPL